MCVTPLTASVPSRERGISLARSPSCSSSRCADLLSAIDGLHWKQMLASSWMATDGTGIQVSLQSCLQSTRKLELIATTRWPSFSTTHQTATLPPSSGRPRLSCDAEHRFNALCFGRSSKRAHNAHDDASSVVRKHAARPSAEGGRLIGAMYGEERRPRNGTRGEALRVHRGTHRPIARSFERWLPAADDAITIRADGGGDAYVQESRAALFRFVDDPLVPMQLARSASSRTSPSRSTCTFAGTPKALTALRPAGHHRDCRALSVPSAGLSRREFERIGNPTGPLRPPLRSSPRGLKKPSASPRQSEAGSRRRGRSRRMAWDEPIIKSPAACGVKMRADCTRSCFVQTARTHAGETPSLKMARPLIHDVLPNACPWRSLPSPHCASRPLRDRDRRRPLAGKDGSVPRWE